MYFCKQWGEETGPFTAEEIRRKARLGELQPDHFVRSENSEKWVTADRIPNLEFPSENRPRSKPQPGTPLEVKNELTHHRQSKYSFATLILGCTIGIGIYQNNLTTRNVLEQRLNHRYGLNSAA